MKEGVIVCEIGPTGLTLFCTVLDFGENELPGRQFKPGV